MNEEIAEKTSLEIKRFIDAPAARVYEAWTDPAQLKEWWGPEGVRIRSLSADPRVGGKYRWDLVNQEGEEMSLFGEYRELLPGKKIVFTWQWDDDEVWQNRTSIVTIELSDRDAGTEVRLRHEQLPSEESRDRHNQGWNSVLDRLEQFVGK
jgi:glutathione S-transferase